MSNVNETIVNEDEILLEETVSTPNPKTTTTKQTMDMFGVDSMTDRDILEDGDVKVNSVASDSSEPVDVTATENETKSETVNQVGNMLKNGATKLYDGAKATFNKVKEHIEAFKEDPAAALEKYKEFISNVGGNVKDALSSDNTTQPHTGDQDGDSYQDDGPGY